MRSHFSFLLRWQLCLKGFDMRATPYYILFCLGYSGTSSPAPSVQSTHGGLDRDGWFSIGHRLRGLRVVPQAPRCPHSASALWKGVFASLALGVLTERRRTLEAGLSLSIEDDGASAFDLESLTTPLVRPTPFRLSRGNIVLFFGGGNHAATYGLPGGGASPVRRLIPRVIAADRREPSRAFRWR